MTFVDVKFLSGDSHPVLEKGETIKRIKDELVITKKEGVLRMNWSNICWYSVAKGTRRRLTEEAMKRKMADANPTPY